mmetsp:Transcript_24407/g.65220  ORF Transcript_24407/g.65220 Transcript_24407/m.65220 type:complete len:169 (-) Transcript_24407:56-562(-)
MHNSPMTYFKSDLPLDVSSLRPALMTNASAERFVTYPTFVRGPRGSLHFFFRSGGSGRGRNYHNAYDTSAGVWSLLTPHGLHDGTGRSSAYMERPVLGPDGYYHLAWLWRDSPDVSTNHDLCYVKSRDLLQWETAAGDVVEIPLKPSTRSVIADPVRRFGRILSLLRR